MSTVSINPKEISKEKGAVALKSVLAALCMTALKLTTGLLTGSLGMLSDAAHSGLDLAGAGMTLISVRLSDRPADADHPYGHGKFENLSAFAETFLMAASSVWIVYEAVERIFLHPVEIRFSPWPFAVLLTSISVDWWRSHQLMKVAQKYNSAALRADALHFASDIWASVAVIVGLLASWIGALTQLKWLHYADPLAAVAVSVMILRFGWHLASDTLGVLMDAVPADVPRKVKREVQSVEGVLSVEQARVRRSGANYFADLTLALDRKLTFQNAEEVVQAATMAVQRVLPDADVVIHTVPREDSEENVFDRVRAVGLRRAVNMHDLSVQNYDGKLHVEYHVELPETLSLRQAHDFTTQLEGEVLHDVPEVSSILTHIESEPATIEKAETVNSDRTIEHTLRELAEQMPEIIDIHEVVVGRTGDRIQLSCHCTLPDELSMQRVHEIITELEDRFKLKHPEVYRVLIHPEPRTDNRR